MSTLTTTTVVTGKKQTGLTTRLIVMAIKATKTGPVIIRFANEESKRLHANRLSFFICQGLQHFIYDEVDVEKCCAFYANRTHNVSMPTKDCQNELLDNVNLFLTYVGAHFPSLAQDPSKITIVFDAEEDLHALARLEEVYTSPILSKLNHVIIGHVIK